MLFQDPEIAGYVPVQGGRIWYRLNGANKPGAPLVGITGGPGMSHHYLLPLLAAGDDRPVILYDQLDTGNSDRPGDTENWTVERYVTELDALRAALGYERIVPVGHSWGGILAAEFALAHPERTQALVLVSPCLSARRWCDDAKALIAGMPADLQAIIADCEARGDFDNDDYARAKKEFNSRHVRRLDPAPPELAHSAAQFNDALYNHLWGPSEFTATGLVRDYDAEQRLGELAMPVLITAGEHDEARPATMRHFASLMPRASVAEIPGASHLAFLEARDTFAAALRDFLGRMG